MSFPSSFSTSTPFSQQTSTNSNLNLNDFPKLEIPSGWGSIPTSKDHPTTKLVHLLSTKLNTENGEQLQTVSRLFNGGLGKFDLLPSDSSAAVASMAAGALTSESVGFTNFFGIRHDFSNLTTAGNLLTISSERPNKHKILYFRNENNTFKKKCDTVEKVDGKFFEVKIDGKPDAPVKIINDDYSQRFSSCQTKVRLSALITHICRLASVCFTGAALLRASGLVKQGTQVHYLIPLAISVAGAIGVFFKNKAYSLELANTILEIRTTARAG